MWVWGVAQIGRSGLSFALTMIILDISLQSSLVAGRTLKFIAAAGENKPSPSEKSNEQKRVRRATDTGTTSGVVNLFQKAN